MEDDNLVKGIFEEGWSNWALISACHVPTRSNLQIQARVRVLFEFKDGIMVLKDQKKKGTLMT